MLTLICLIALNHGSIHGRERVHYGMTKRQANVLAAKLGADDWTDPRFGRLACGYIQREIGPDEEAAKVLAVSYHGVNWQTTTAND